MNKRLHITCSKLLIGVFVLLFVACSRGRSDFQLVPEFKSATNTYHTGTVAEAENALRQFVTRTEANIETAKTDREGDYKKLLDMSWLRLASIYRAEGNAEKYRGAMAKAISYFDQDSANASDPKYQKDKEGNLLEFLSQLEAADMPTWKKERMAQGSEKK